MFPRAALIASCFAAVVLGQQAGTITAETHPNLPSQKCTKAGGCVTVNTKIVLDSNWRWLHNSAPNTYNNCYDGNKWDATLCPDPVTCSKNCALDGADYSGTYGITVSGNALNLKFVTAKNVGSRVYLMADDTNYQMFNLVGQEFAMDVDMSNLPCGLNGAVYFSEMAKDGGLSATNKAGAKYGTGYCDSQCPHDIKFINGEANIIGWNGTSANSGAGQYGTCCAEMDIWEANSQAAAYTPHPCSGTGLQRCSGTTCGDGDNRYSGICDKDGCDWNSYRMGDKTFLGAGASFAIDTTKKFSLITQFISSDGTQSGTLTEIRRVYVQNGKVISNSQSQVPGVTGNSLTDPFCAVQKGVFENQNYFKTVGGMAAMGNSFKRGMVLALSLWDDYAANALWLDSNYPLDLDPSKPGVARGPCGTDTGKPADVEAKYPNSNVIFSNIKWGEIGSTFSGTETGITTKPGSSSTTSRSSSTSSTRTSSSNTPAPSPTNVAEHYAQCGGKTWTGPTVCRAPYTCKASGDYYSQCL